MMTMIMLWACSTPTPLPAGDVARGAELHRTECALCHGNDAEGSSRGPALEALDQPDAIDAIRFGRGDMPAFDWSEQDLADWWTWLDARSSVDGNF